MQGVGAAREEPAAAADAAAATAVSQELWTSGGALFQRAQEPNIPFGGSLTSTCACAERKWNLCGSYIWAKALK